jgi:AraC-like DNA-binding protein
MIAAARKVTELAASPERLYYPRSSGHIFATSHVTRRRMQVPFYGFIAFTRDGSDLTIHTEDAHAMTGNALAVCARTVRFLDCHSDLILIAVNPLHRNFRAFTRIASPHAIAMDRRSFAQFEPALHHALDGSLTHEAALALFDGVQQAAHSYLPAVPKLDERTQILVQTLWSNPRCSVTDLAQHLGLSYHRTSHYFAEAVGIPMRTYQLWQKLFRAGGPLLAGASLTEAAQAAGFVDSSHYSSAFQKAYGRAPSAMFRNPRVSIYATNPFCTGRRELNSAAQ